MGRTKTITTPDLITLSLLAERPMHGYELVGVLEYRDVGDWAAISTPQVYYSLRKLFHGGYIESVAPPTTSMGPAKETYAPTAKGMTALRDGLASATWATQRPPPPFLTWLALSTHATPAVAKAQIERRRQFLSAEIAKERETLAAIREDEGEMVQVAELMVEFTISQFEAERDWLDEIQRRLGL
jgi:DNA-binding PadR family transcriptional regulator